MTNCCRKGCEKKATHWIVFRGWKGGQSLETVNNPDLAVCDEHAKETRDDPASVGFDDEWLNGIGKRLEAEQGLAAPDKWEVLVNKMKKP